MSAGKPHRSRFRHFTIAWPFLLLIVLVAGFPAHASSQQAGSVTGRVRSETTGSPLAGATVELVNSDGSRAVVTDKDGRYLLSNVPPGRATIRVRHLGHDPFELEALIAAGREITVDLSLPLQPLTLEPVHVDGSQLGSGMDTIVVPEAELGTVTAASWSRRRRSAR